MIHSLKISIKELNKSISLTHYKENPPSAYRQISNNIFYFSESSILISGYRGVGKTTMIRMIEETVRAKYVEDVLQSEILFVHMNMDKYDTYPNFIRNLTRSLYLSFEKNFEDKADKKSNELRKNLEKLYRQTFFTLSEKYKLTNSDLKETSLSVKFKLADFFKKVVPIFLLCMGGILSCFNLGKVSGLPILIIGFLSFVADRITFEKTKIEKEEVLEELSADSFYDNEIAEYRFFEILDILKCNKVKVVFVFDEIDKIDTPKKLEKTISELKKLILHEGSNSILIAGQQLFYKLASANLSDDGFLSSMFSTVFHVPMMQSEELKDKVDSYFKNDSYKSNSILDQYLDSAILRSNCVLRQLRHEIISDISWADEDPVVNLNESRVIEMKIDSQILKSISRIIENQPYFQISDAKSDLVRYHLYVWVNRMKQYKFSSFFAEDIYDRESLMHKKYPLSSIIEMDQVFPILLNEMIKSNILKKEESEKKTEIIYRWVDKIKISPENISKNLESISSLYSQSQAVANFYKNFDHDFIENCLIKNPQFSQINDFLKLNDDIFNNKKLSAEEIQYLQELVEKLNVNKPNLLEEFTRYVVTEMFYYDGFTDQSKASHRYQGDQPDIVISSETSELLFEVKYLANPRLSNSILNQLFSLLNQRIKENRINSQSKDVLLFLIIFQNEHRNSEDIEFDEKKIQSAIKKFNETFPELDNNLFIVYLPVVNRDLLESRISSAIMTRKQL